MQISSSTPPAQRVRLTAHIDASEGNSEPYWAARMDDVQQAAASSEGQMEGAVKLFRGGVSRTEKVLKGLGHLGMMVAAPVAGFMIGGPIGLGVGLLADAGMFVGGTFRAGVGSLTSAYQQHDYAPVDWKGSVTAPLDGGAHDAPTGGDAHPTGEGLTQFLKENVRPDDLNVVFLAGHGLGSHQTAGLKLNEVSSALGQAGTVPQLLLMESCLTSNAETLSALQGKAQVAILSEEVIKLNQNRLPLQEMLGEATEGGTPQEIARRMVEKAAEDPGLLTLTAVDVEKFGKVRDALGVLGGGLILSLADGKQKELQAAVKGAEAYPNLGLMPLERAMVKNSDLGQFLDNLGRAGLRPEVGAAAAQARTALTDSIVALHNGTGYEKAFGVAFQTGFGALDQSDKVSGFHDADMPPTWTAFLGLLHDKDAQAKARALIQAS